MPVHQLQRLHMYAFDDYLAVLNSTYTNLHSNPRTHCIMLECTQELLMCFRLSNALPASARTNSNQKAAAMQISGTYSESASDEQNAALKQVALTRPDAPAKDELKSMGYDFAMKV